MANRESNPGTTSTSPVCNLSEEKSKPRVEKIEDEVAVYQQRMDVKEKKEKEIAEGNSQPDSAIISQDEGKHDHQVTHRFHLRRAKTFYDFFLLKLFQ